MRRKAFASDIWPRERAAPTSVCMAAIQIRVSALLLVGLGYSYKEITELLGWIYTKLRLKTIAQFREGAEPPGAPDPQLTERGRPQRNRRRDPRRLPRPPITAARLDPALLPAPAPMLPPTSHSPNREQSASRRKYDGPAQRARSQAEIAQIGGREECLSSQRFESAD